MTNEALSEYINRAVELQLLTGERPTGELIAGGDVQIVFGSALRNQAACGVID
ncbi:MAG: hypothetical protein WB526_07440 [Candidatus Cybelea sp.]